MSRRPMAAERPHRGGQHGRLRDAWPEVRALLHRHRASLAVGMLLMLLNRVAGLVLPGTSKFLIDDVLGQGRMDLLLPLAGVAALATSSRPAPASAWPRW
jgi:ABC-type bacteriocin/lantibiotic exporter with double-glycine peptidase domain